MSHFEALFNLKLLGPHCVTAGKAAFQLTRTHMEVQRMCLPSWREASNFGWGKTVFLQRLWLLEVLSQLGRLFPIYPISGPLHIQLGSRQSQYRRCYRKDREGQRP